MPTSAKMIADSISPDGVRICTIECVLWRPLLAELNTYRDFSRNGASSRARSIKKTLQEVLEDTAIPTEFRREHIGMSGGDLLEGDELADAIDTVLELRDDALRGARRLVELGVHKSIVNRYIEPFMWHTHVITATNWDNFLEQRLALLEDGRKGSDPMMYDLAVAVKDALGGSVPTPLEYGQWHMPYIQQRDHSMVPPLVSGTLSPDEILRRVSVARCAGTSYLTQDKQNRDLRDDLRIHGNLVSAEPPHWSPFEHVATPARGLRLNMTNQPPIPPRRFNLTGWASLRWFAENDTAVG